MQFSYRCFVLLILDSMIFYICLGRDLNWVSECLFFEQAYSLGRLIVGIAGSNPVERMDVRVLCSLHVV